MSERTQKLVALRARTDADLIVLASRELDRGSALLDVVASQQSPFFAQARKSLATATAIMSRVADVDEEQRLRLAKKAAELQARLLAVPRWANARPFSASVAS